MRQRGFVFVVFLLCSGWMTGVFADVSWNVESGIWSVGSNWDVGRTPDATDSYIYIRKSNTSVCTLNTNEGLFSARLVMQNGQTLNIENGGSVGTKWARVGRESAAYVNMADNAAFVMNDDDLYIGLENGTCVWTMAGVSSLTACNTDENPDELYIGYRGGKGTLKLVGSGLTVQADALYLGSGDGEWSSPQATLEFVLDAGGGSAIITGSTSIASVGSAHLVLSASVDLAQQDIVLIETTGTGAIGGNGVFNTVNGVAAEEGAVVDVGGNTYSLTYQYEAGGDGYLNDVALIFIKKTSWASDPSPQGGDKTDPDHTILSWQPGPEAIRSEVYLGTDPMDVANARKLVGDVNGDGITDILDLAALAAQWLGAPADPCPDLDYSGLVDLADAADLARDWERSADALYLGATAGNTMDPGPLTTGTTYYWRVDTVRCDGIEAGPVWSFQTKVPAFPGAEGFGKWASGGRGGTVYRVTNLNDSGPGSFRDAVSATNRTVIFDVAGVIQIGERIVMSKDITIAGQTAPGEGVMIYGNGVSYTDANRSITRHMRYRMGKIGTSGKDAIALADGTDMIFDHRSVSWGRDENFSISGGSDEDPGFITIQDSIIGQGLETHSCGGLIQNWNGVSLFRNLYIDNNTRNPKVKGVNDFTNNVVYNWNVAAYILGDSAADSYANVLNNYFISGPNTGAAPFTRGNLNFHIYASNNWHDSNKNGSLDGSILSQAAYGTVDWQTVPYDYPGVKTMLTPPAAVKTVASRAGASIPMRDRTDRRLVEELASYGTMGQLISDESASPMNGVGILESGYQSKDTDWDGMPDYWEQASAGLDPYTPDNNGDLNNNGYTNLEEYLNWRADLHSDVQKNTPLDMDLRKCTPGFGSGAVFTVSNAVGGSVQLLADDYTARFTPDTDYTGPAAFDFTVNDGAAATETVCLFVSEFGGCPQDPVYPSAPVSGLSYKYYESIWEYLPTGFDSMRVIDSGVIANFDISGAGRDDYFVYLFEGFINVPADGLYTFYVNSDDGSRLYINNGIVVSNDGMHGSRELAGNVSLRAGLHRIKLTYFEYDGDQQLDVQWAGPGFSRQPISEAQLYHGSLDIIPPDVPVGLWAQADNDTVMLDWEDNTESDLAGYNVYRTTTSGMMYVQVNESLLSTSAYIDSDVEVGTLYHYVVTAVDFSFNESNYPYEVSAVLVSSGISTLIQEYTTGFCGVDGTVDNNNAGFTGYGFANADNVTGSGIDWRINVAAAGTYTLSWRFANGSTADRPANFLVNGTTVISGVSFPVTGGWTTWSEVSRTVTLPAGILTIRLEATGSAGPANIDYIRIAGADVKPSHCP